jgi:hypothetical protein
MAFNQAQLDALDEAIASGSLKVKYADKELTYRSLSEMMQLRDLMAKSLGKKQSGSSRVYMSTSKGLEDCE